MLKTNLSESEIIEYKSLRELKNTVGLLDPVKVRRLIQLTRKMKGVTK